MHGRSSAVAAMVIVVASACGGEPLDEIPVADASFGDVDWVMVGAVVGLASATGTLFVTEPDGTAHELPIRLEGPSLGVVMDFHVSNDDGCLFDDGASLDLSGASADLTARDLGGLYTGTTAGAGMLLGGIEHDLTNAAGVRIGGGGSGLNVGVWAGVESLGMTIVEP